MGIKYATVIHDGGAHPGDKTAITTRWLLRDARAADLVITLSQAVARSLRKAGLSQLSWRLSEC